MFENFPTRVYLHLLVSLFMKSSFMKIKAGRLCLVVNMWELISTGTSLLAWLAIKLAAKECTIVKGGGSGI